MKRGIKALCKYLLVSISTVVATVIVFNFLRSNENHRRGTHGTLQGQGMFPIEPESLILERDSMLEAGSQIHNVKKIDWHNYDQISAESKRVGIGEHGVPVHLDFKKYDKSKYDELFKVNGFNAYLSDMISLNRSIPDIRHKACKDKKYLSSLPTVSVVVPFFNEHWSVLLRTVYSVIIRSPPSLMKQIILVDDCSTKAHTKKPLDDFVRKHLSHIVQVIHLPSRQGLIRARLAGAKAATGDVLLFLDAHSEANVNWLPPLLEPIAENYKTCVCPFIDVISYEDFEYRAQDEGARGAFDWEMLYKRLPLLPEDLKHPAEPFKSPIMAGGLFAISARFFWELGGYDPGLDIWGGEQYELSFKIWQCGGSMVDAPCSRVGHIYKKFSPNPNPGIGDFVGKNMRRVAEVWMDEYAEYIYKRKPHYRSLDPGDLTAQREIRTRLKCKPFKWFIETVAFDLVKKYPPVEPPDFAWGQISSQVLEKYCVDMENKDASSPPLRLQECLKPGTRKKRGDKHEQDFRFTFEKDIASKKRKMCLDVSDAGPRPPIKVFSCHGSQGNQLWRYDPETSWIMHGKNPNCLDTDVDKKSLFLSLCDKDSATQKWKISHVNHTALASWHDEKEKEL
ncbi:hypothetical protein M8J76_000430 [Diaphorina citri]|nr:hypothetical protein M8J76_000430 [Diaphorina citri]